MEEEWIYLPGDRKYAKYIAISNLGHLMKKNGEVVNLRRRSIMISVDKKLFRLSNFVLDNFLVTVKRPDQVIAHVIDRNALNVFSVENLKYVSKAELSEDSVFKERVSKASSNQWKDQLYVEKWRNSINETYSKDDSLRVKASMRMKKLYEDPDFRKKMGERIKSGMTEDARKKISEKSKQAWENKKLRKIASLRARMLNSGKPRPDISRLSLKKILFRCMFRPFGKSNSSLGTFIGTIGRKAFKGTDKEITCFDTRNVNRRNKRHQEFDYKFGYFVDCLKSYAKSTVDLASDAEVLADIL